MVAVAVSALIFAGCCTCRQSKNKPKALVGTQWEMIQVGGQPFENNGLYNFSLSEEGSVSGVGDCNRIMGNYTKKEINKTHGEINMGPLAATRMMCPNQDMENKFMKALTSADNYKIDASMLFLYQGKELLAIMQADRWKK